VVLNAYSATTNYPYSARFGRPGTESFNYVRNAGVSVMDAYSGETTFYAPDGREPILATWQKVYPDLFTPMAEMPQSLREHLRFGEDQFQYMSVALERFHVSDVDAFFNNNEAWAPTQEAVGTGAQGQREDSPARYTYAVMPDETASSSCSSAPTSRAPRDAASASRPGSRSPTSLTPSARPPSCASRRPRTSRSTRSTPSRPT
jgi:uncharacterized membrane protein (UPF0182 family)